MVNHTSGRRRVLTDEEFAEMRTVVNDPGYLRRLTLDHQSEGMVEVDNPMRREVRPRRGTETAA